MPNCKKVPGPTPGRLLAMSVIEEEPAHMRDSSLQEPEKRSDYNNSSNEGCRVEQKDRSSPPLIKTGPNCTVRGPDTAIVPATVAFSSASTAATSATDKHHVSRNLRVAMRPRRTSRLDFSQDSCGERRSRQHCLPSRKERSPRSRKRPTHEMRLGPGYAPCSKTVVSSSSEEDDVENQPQRLPRYHANPHNYNRHKSSSISPSKEYTMPQERALRQTPSPSLSSQDEASRTKKSTKFDSITSSTIQDVYDSRPRAASRQAQRPQTSLRVKTRSRSSTMLPPFREPYAEREYAQVKASYESSARPAEEHIHNRIPRQVSLKNSNKSKTSSPLNTSPFLSDIGMSEDRRTRASRALSSPSTRHILPIPKPRVKSHTNLEQREVASCRGTKAPISPSKMGLFSLKNQHQTALLPYRDTRRTRSTSLHPEKASEPKSKEESIPRSASASSLTSHGSTPSPRASVPQIPLRLRHYEGRFSNRRKQTLFYFSLFPAEKMPMRGVVVCLHGIGDHCRRNVKLYERLCREGFGVITYDLLNHGVSDLDQHKIRAHISNFNCLVDDTNDFITFAKRVIYKDALRYWRKQFFNHRQENGTDKHSQPQLPLIIAGTSFGSLLGIHTILAGEHKFHAAVWSSPTVGVTWNPLLWAESKLAKPLAAILPTAKVVPAVPHERLCRDPKFLRRFRADPLTSMDMMTSRSGHESLQAMIQLEDDKRVTDSESAFCAVPTLFLAGSADSISDQQAAIKFFGTMGNFDKEFKLFDGLFHLVYEEPEKEDVFRYLTRWLHRRFPAELC